jgi:hypothetical protein
MLRQYLALVCVLSLLYAPLNRAALASQAQTAPKPTIKERFTEIPAGSVIEVKLVNKQKLKGRLGTLTDSDFEIQHTANNQIVTDRVAFNDVKSVKLLGKGMSTGMKIVVGTLVGAGVLLIIGVVACAAGGCFSY